MKNERAWDISVEDLVVGYGNHIVLSGVSAYIPAGAITTVLGESGCGKTTLLRTLLGLTSPKSGKIFLGGNDLSAISDREVRKLRRRFGILFQDGALISSLTLAENVYLPLMEHTHLPVSVLKESAMQTLELVGLENFGNYYPGELSGGMRKRAGLARAIITEPQILFCDEPTSGLDPMTASQMDQLLIDMKRYYPSMTILVVTHDLQSVQQIADNVLLVRSGKTLFSGTKTELFQSCDPYLEKFRSRSFEEDRRMTAPPLKSIVRDALTKWINK